MRSFVKTNFRSSRNGEITLCFTDVGKSCPSRDFNVTNMSFNAIREHIILSQNGQSRHFDHNNVMTVDTMS